MTIEIKEGRYFVAIWFVKGVGMDFLGSVYRDPGQSFRIIYRFRYYKDDKAFDSEDKKSWYLADLKDASDEPKAESTMEELIEVLTKAGFSKGMPDPIQKIPLHTEDCEVILKALESIPNFEMRKA